MLEERKWFRELKQWRDDQSSKLIDPDGLDMAYIDGIDVVLTELLKWDGGISESYLEGIQDAITKLEAITEGEEC